MSKNKWSFVADFIKTAARQQLITEGKVNKQAIAYAMIEHFELKDLHPDTARKVVSLTLNKGKEATKVKVSVSNLSIKELETLIEERKNEKKVKQFNKVGFHIVSGCWHVPFHNKAIARGMHQLIEDLGEDLAGFHLIGDFLDLNTLSSHDRGRFTAIPGLTLSEEYKEGNKELDEIDRRLHRKDVVKTYLYGNHEDRHSRYVADMQNAKIPPPSPKDALNLEKRGYNIYTNWNDDYITLGDHLDLIHGTYYNVHCAKKHMDVFRGSVMFVHTHRIQTYIEGNTGSFNIGFLGEKESKTFNYASRAQKASWQNGFAVVYIDENQDYFVTNVICNNDKFVYNGKVYK